MKALISLFTAKNAEGKANRVVFTFALVLLIVFVILVCIFMSFQIKGTKERNLKAESIKQKIEMSKTENNSSLWMHEDVYHNSDLEFAADEQLSTSYRIEFLDVGAADCTLLTNGRKTMLVDVGDEMDGDMITKYLHSSDILSISVILCTNENPEHIGGLYTILSNFDVDTLILPNLETDNEVLQNCISLANEKNVQLLNAKALETWNIGEAQCQILSVGQNVISRLVVGSHSFLLMSDATAEEERALISLEVNITADFLKASNHGSEGTSYDDFLRAVGADIAIVSCDEDIAKPNIKTMNRLYKRGTAYRTDKNDSLIVITDGVFYRVTSEWTNCDGTYDYN